MIEKKTLSLMSTLSLAFMRKRFLQFKESLLCMLKLLADLETPGFMQVCFAA